MTTTYKLVAFSRNVELPILPDGKHSGYGLVKYEDGIAVGMKTVEVTALYNNMNFANSNDALSGAIDGWISLNPELSVNGQIVPMRKFENNVWADTTAEWVEASGYKVVLVKDESGQDIANPEELYRQIQNNAYLLNKTGMAYDPLMQNCNTWTNYIDKTILGDVDIFEQLNANTTPPDAYVGSSAALPNIHIDLYLFGFSGLVMAKHIYYKDCAIMEQIEEIQDYLNDNNLSCEDIQCSVNMKINQICTMITTDNMQQSFQTPIICPINYVKACLNNKRTTAQVNQSPLVLDLDGDGVETIGTEEKVYFDHDNNGFAESSGWVGADDGLLVRDINNNGKIDNGTELFGNNSVLSSGAKAANGFEALADLDSNNDGVFNSSDTAWNQVKVWKDANQNGEVDSGELLTLAQAGVSGINLEYDNATTTDENGNEHKQTGTFIKTDGTTGSVHDVWFDGDNSDTIDLSDVEISETIAALPDIQDSDGNTALFWANGEKESIDMLIKAGAKTDIRNKNGSLYYQVDSIPILGLSTNL